MQAYFLYLTLDLSQHQIALSFDFTFLPCLLLPNYLQVVHLPFRYIPRDFADCICAPATNAVHHLQQMFIFYMIDWKVLYASILKVCTHATNIKLDHFISKFIILDRAAMALSLYIYHIFLTLCFTLSRLLSAVLISMIQNVKPCFKVWHSLYSTIHLSRLIFIHTAELFVDNIL